MKATESAMSTFHIEWEKNIIYYTILYDYKIWKETKGQGVSTETGLYTRNALSAQ